MYAANAVITLTGFPGAGRRLLLRLESASARLGCPEPVRRFSRSSRRQTVSADQVRGWVTDWTATYQAAQSEDAEALHPARLPIYLRGFAAQIDADRAADMLWLLLFTWQSALRRLPSNGAGVPGYIDLLDSLGMADAPGFRLRVGAAIAFGRQCQHQVAEWGPPQRRLSASGILGQARFMLQLGCAFHSAGSSDGSPNEPRRREVREGQGACVQGQRIHMAWRSSRLRGFL